MDWRHILWTRKFLYTVNVVNFTGAKFLISQKSWKDLLRGGNFHDTTPISLIKSYGFYFHAGEIFTRMHPQKRENYFHAKSTTFTVRQLWLRIILWGFIANRLEAKTIIFRYFLARYRNFLPQVDQKVHQVLQNLPRAFCIGDAIRYDSIKPEKNYEI